MASQERGMATAKLLIVVVVAAVLAAVISVAAQQWLVGDTNPAVTGGVSGAISALIATRAQSRKDGSA